MASYRHFVGGLWDRYGEQAWLGPWCRVHQRGPGNRRSSMSWPGSRTPMPPVGPAAARRGPGSSPCPPGAGAPVRRPGSPWDPARSRGRGDLLRGLAGIDFDGVTHVPPPGGHAQEQHRDRGDPPELAQEALGSGEQVVVPREVRADPVGARESGRASQRYEVGLGDQPVPRPVGDDAGPQRPRPVGDDPDEQR